MRGPAVTGLIVAVVSIALAAQADAPRPSFEVATIKRNVTLDGGGGGGLMPGGRFRMANVDVQLLIRVAFRNGPQLFPSQIVGAPAWISSERYDIAATLPPELAGKPLPELFRVQPRLVQSLLEDRFKLKAHRETREMPIYALVRARRDGMLGPQLRRSEIDCGTERTRCGIQDGPARFTAGSVPISTLVAMLAPALERVVIDRTDLDGRFDVTLDFAPERAPLPAATDVAPPASDKPSIFTALQEQLGLRLESGRGPVDVVVIDRIERPTED